MDWQGLASIGLLFESQTGLHVSTIQMYILQKYIAWYEFYDIMAMEHLWYMANSIAQYPKPNR